MIPDVPGKDGEPSTAEIYVNALSKLGLSVAGVHFHWWGSYVFVDKEQPIDRGVTAVHHQAIGMDPIEFTNKTIIALKKALKVIERRTGH